MNLNQLVPKRLRPYAKAVVALAFTLIPLVYSAAFTGASAEQKLIMVVTAVAVTLGVAHTANTAVPRR